MQLNSDNESDVSSNTNNDVILVPKRGSSGPYTERLKRSTN